MGPADRQYQSKTSQYKQCRTEHWVCAALLLICQSGFSNGHVLPQTSHWIRSLNSTVVSSIWQWDNNLHPGEFLALVTHSVYAKSKILVRKPPKSEPELTGHHANIPLQHVQGKSSNLIGRQLSAEAAKESEIIRGLDELILVASLNCGVLCLQPFTTLYYTAL